MCLGSIGSVTALWEANGLTVGRVRLDGGSEVEACLALTPEAVVGSTVLIQMGFSVELLDDEAAADALRLRSADRVSR